MNEGPNMATFGERQARRFRERKGYARSSLHGYRPHKEALNPKKRAEALKFWFLDLASSKRRSQSKQFEQTLTTWKRPQTLVRLGCFYARTGWKPRHDAG